MFIRYEGNKRKKENEKDNNSKLMRYFDNLKHEVKSCYNGGVMHN